MFQNLNETEKTKENMGKTKNIFANVISKKYIIVYIITFMVSMVNMKFDISPFCLSLIAAAVAYEIPVIGIVLFAFIGNTISCGINGIINFITTILIFFVSFFIKEPKYNDSNRNEKRLLSKRIFFASLVVNIVKLFINQFLIYDLLVALAFSIIVVVFYKIFVNALSVITNYNEKMAFSIEEIIATSLLVSIACCAFGNLQIFGFSVRNVLSIFIVLLLGWKNGMLVGTSSGVSIGITLGIIAGNEPIVVAAYALSGMIAGFLNRFGKIGVILGFVLGNIILSYVASGMAINAILFKEILIAGIALLAVPKNINLSIEDMIGTNKFLPVGFGRSLNKSKETANRLKDVSKVVQAMANTYKRAAATVIDEKDIKEKNKQKFIAELLNYIDNMEENILYEEIEKVEGKNLDDIFNLLLEKQFIKEKDLLNVLANNNSYVLGFDDNDQHLKKDIEKMVNVINSAYRISKMNFIWEKKIDEEKKNFESQLNGVSKAISEIAQDITEEAQNEDENIDLKEQIAVLLKQKCILPQDIVITKKENERYKIDLYIEKSKEKDLEKNIVLILNKVLNEKVLIKSSEEIESENTIKFKIISEDKYLIDIGHAIALKDGMSVSGDSILNTKLKDGKTLIAISDGMGSGEEAKKSSQIVISMLKRLLNSGFDKKTSLDLINTNLLNIADDVFATLDIAIVDLYNGTVEFIKNGACPTYIKQNKRIQIIKSLTLPTGILKEATADVFDRDIEDEEITVMVSDGILDSNIEYKNKELWLKYLLEDIEIKNPQKIADIILNEAIDNNFGNVKDDMSIIVWKVMKKDKEN